MPDPTRTRKNFPTRIGDVLAQLIARRGIGRVHDTTELDQAWKAVVGSPGDQFSWPGRIRAGVLEVLVQHSVLVQEFEFHKAQLVERLGQILPEKAIKEIKFRVGKRT